MRDYCGLSIYTSAADGYDIGYCAGVKDAEKIAIENGKKAIDEDCKERLKELQKGTIELSVRRGIPLDIEIS